MLSQILLMALAPFALAASSGGFKLQLNDPLFYRVLEPNTKLECRHIKDKSYGVIFERGKGPEVRVSLITNNKREDEKSSFKVAVKSDNHEQLVLYAENRTGDTGRFYDIKIKKRRSPEAAYGLPAMMTIASAIFVKEEDGKERRDLYLDGVFRMGCKPQLLR